jgi:thiosulfate dehydrogenase
VAPRVTLALVVAAATAATVVACGEGATPRPAARERATAGRAARDTGESLGSTIPAPAVERDETPDATAARFDSAAWRPPADSEITNDSLGASVRRGLALVVHTNDSLPRYAPGRIACASCHLDAGRNRDAIPLAGSHARYPRYVDRAGAVVTLADRVNYCFTRSLAGLRLPSDSREMADILAYIAFLSRGIPVGASVAGGPSLPPMPDSLAGDTARGRAVYASTCATCHGANGEGNPAIPPGVPALWGAKSYSVGASMAREERAASFIWHNMPLGRPKSLTPQQAFDVAAYVNSHPRPDSPGKERDWPAGKAPRDVPYDTRSGHEAYRPPPLLRRANASRAVVPAPPRAAR